MVANCRLLFLNVHEMLVITLNGVVRDFCCCVLFVYCIDNIKKHIYNRYLFEFRECVYFSVTTNYPDSGFASNNDGLQ